MTMEAGTALKTWREMALAPVPVIHRYRYCASCYREWPMDRALCPSCGRWLGDEPLSRTDWQLAPAEDDTRYGDDYEVICGAAVLLRMSGPRPDEPFLVELKAGLDRALSAVPELSILDQAGHGWFLWAVAAERRAFLATRRLEHALATEIDRFRDWLVGISAIRWGLWLDLFLLPVDAASVPVPSKEGTASIFAFDPQDCLIVGDPVFRATRPWVHFVASSARVDGSGKTGYRVLGEKTPSALAHRAAKAISPFRNRTRELATMETAWRKCEHTTLRLAIIAKPGSGKTRLIAEWLGRHPEANALKANFSLFGGDTADLVAQLAPMPLKSLDSGALLSSVHEAVQNARAKVLVIDDIHWARPEDVNFLERLLGADLPAGLLVILSSRPQGIAVLERIGFGEEVLLSPLGNDDIGVLARSLIPNKSLARWAAAHAFGNPLFIEQFAAWASETNARRTKGAPRTLHQVIAGRLRHLEDVRLRDLRQRMNWSPNWMCDSFKAELAQIEMEVGLWLDRLETGDLADRRDVVRYVSCLERIDYELSLLAMRLRITRSRSGRLREALERLMLGSADEIWKDMRGRLSVARGATRMNIAHEARRMGAIAFESLQWQAACHFYRLALKASEESAGDLTGRIKLCLDRIGSAFGDTAIDTSLAIRIERAPAISRSELPDIWMALGERYGRREYFFRAAAAAEDIRAPVLAQRARARAMQPENGGQPRES